MKPIALSNGQARIIIRPDLGAGLTAFDVMLGRDWAPIFRTVDPDETHPFALSNILLVPFSGRVSGGGFTFDGIFHAVERNMPTEKYPIHGNGFSSVWTVTNETDTSLTMALAASGPGPYRYDAEMTYRLDGPALVMELKITNRADIRLPYGAGSHPWFVRDAETYLTAPADRVWLEQDDHLPRALEPLAAHPHMDFNARSKLPSAWINNWFTGWNRAARIEWTARGLAVDIEASTPLDQYVVFSPSGEADYFCFEPVSHPVDAVNLPEGPEAHGMTVLEPGGTLSVSTRFAVSTLA